MLMLAAFAATSNFTIAPRTADEVEAVMAGGDWPPAQVRVLCSVFCGLLSVFCVLWSVVFGL